MCCRYYYDEKIAKEIEKICIRIDRELKIEAREVRPSQKALVITGRKNRRDLEEMRWGFPPYDDNGLLINARCESIKEKKSFKESVQKRRCVVPASGYFEWDSRKNKVTFNHADKQPVYMAGVYNLVDNADRFVVITTEANEAVRNVHDRMPLILDESEIDMWIHDDRAIEFILHKKSPKLEQHMEYQQRSLWDLSDE